MMWLLLTIIAYAINALVAVADTYVLRRPVRNPSVFAFYVGGLGLVFLVAAPFALRMPPVPVLIAALLAGALFTLNLLALFRALGRSSASRVVPVYGTILPIATLALAWLFAGERLGLREFLAIGVLAASGATLSVSRTEKEAGASHLFLWAALGAVLFAASTVLARYVFLNHAFLSGFIWSRIGGGAAALLFLAYPGFIRTLRESRRTAPPRTDVFVIGVRILAGTGFLMLHYAISLAPVALVNGLKGVEYAFIFLITLLANRFRPWLLNEQETARLRAIKAVAIGGTAIGIALLARAS